MTEYRKIRKGPRGSKLVSIPMKCDLQVGDYVKIDLVVNEVKDK